MTALLADVRHALVALRRRPAGIVVPLLTIAIGIGASTAIFSALHAALFSPLPYPEPERLVMGRATFSGEINPWVAAPDFFDYRDRSTVFQSLSDLASALASLPAEGPLPFRTALVGSEHRRRGARDRLRRRRTAPSRARCRRAARRRGVWRDHERHR